MVRPLALAFAALSTLLVINNLSGYLQGGPVAQLSPVVTHCVVAIAALVVFRLQRATTS